MASCSRAVLIVRSYDLCQRPNNLTLVIVLFIRVVVETVFDQRLRATWSLLRELNHILQAWLLLLHELIEGTHSCFHRSSSERVELHACLLLICIYSCTAETIGGFDFYLIVKVGVEIR